MMSDSASPSALSPSLLSPREHAHRRPHEKRSRHAKGRKHGRRTSAGGASSTGAGTGTGTGSLRKSRLRVNPPSPQLPSWTLHCDTSAARGSVSPFGAGDDSSSSASSSPSPSLYLAPLTPGTELLMEDTNSRLDSLDINESSAAATFGGCGSGLTESALSTQTATDASSVSSCGFAAAALGPQGTPCVLPRNNGALFHRTPVLPVVSSPDPFKRPPAAPGEAHAAVPMSPSKMRRCEVPPVPELVPPFLSPLLPQRTGSGVVVRSPTPHTGRGPKSVLSKSMSSLPRPDLGALSSSGGPTTPQLPLPDLPPPPPPPLLAPLVLGGDVGATTMATTTTADAPRNHDPITYEGVTIDVAGYSGECEVMQKAISADSARALLTGEKPLPAGHRLLVADGRLAFEYDAGHVRGAVNITVSATRGTIREQILRLVERAHAERQKYFVLVYCEFSSARGPRLGNALRTVERDYLAHHRPGADGAFDAHTCFPHIYAIHGGYKQFHARHRDLCVPAGYVTQKDPAYAALNRRLQRLYHDQIADATHSESLRRAHSDNALGTRPAPEPPVPTAKPAPRRLFSSGIFGSSSKFCPDGECEDEDDDLCGNDIDNDDEQLDYLSSSVSTPTRTLGRRCVSCIASVECSTSSSSSNSSSGVNPPEAPSSVEEDDRLDMKQQIQIRPPSFD